MPNARPKRRGRPPKIQNNNNTKYLNNKAEKFYEEEEEEEDDDDDSNQSSIVSDDSSPKYRTRTRRSSRRASKLNVTIEQKKRGRKRKKYASEDEFVDEEYEEPVAQSDDENPESEIEDDDDDDVDENVDDLMDDEEADDDVEDGDDSKRRPVREKAQLFLDDKELPELVLPSSSEDLLISQRELIRALSVYEILKHFSVTLRLTPFRFEDFAVSLLIDEQTYLLSEVHLTLLKALIREDDLVGTQHGPQDVRDSINIYLYLCDHVTWPEVLRIYLSSVSKDETKNLKMIKDCMDCGYPFTSLDKKLTLLEYLCDEFLNTQRAREFLNLEGKIEHDEHCRACQKNGEMLMCDTCPAVFHLGCLDPPLKQVPESEWFCPICKQNQVNGVTDCVNDFEKQMPRQEPIGWDRHGRQYWFLSRRIIVEDCKSDNVWYYTTRLQFDELLNILDADHYEKELHNTLTELKDEIYKQMAITEKLTKTAKGSRKSYLEIVNEELYLRIKSEQSKNDPNGIDEKQAELDSKLAVDEDDLRNGFNGSGGVQTRLKTGTLQQKPIALDPFKNRVNIYNTINTFREDDSVIIMEDDQKSLTRISRKLLPSNYNTTILFKLGFEGNYRNYQNIYSLNPHALSRDQVLDDRDKKRHLSHKFSLTSASELKWASYTNISTESIANNPNGTQVNLINTIRQALLFLETNLSQPFMHPFWKKYRDKWTKAVSLCLDGNSFGLALAILESCMKPVLFNNAWRDSLGFTVLKRTTQAERDELKKKDNKKGRDNPETVVFDDASTSKFNITLGTGIKLINGKLRHQIWKQKGEEYRLSGVGGWLWLNTLCDPIKPDQSKVEKDLSVENEDQPEKAKDDDDDDDDSIVEEDIIDISEALQSRTSNQRKKLYPKLFNESKLDRFLQKRLDMIEFERKLKKPSPAIIDTNPDAGQKPKHNCYSPSCDRETQSKCYSALCQLDYKQRLALENSKKKDLTESVDLQQIIVENGTEQFSKKVVTYMAKGQLPPSGRFSNRKHRTIFIPLPYELRRLGRCGGNCEVDGFNYNAKINNSIWPYGLTPRPNFRTAWLFRTDNMTTLHCVALQLRVLWASIRWDDLAQQPLASGINTITTENEVQTIEIMKRRDLPPFGLASEYLVRKIIVPIDLPVRTREVSTPNRSGLRERRRPESPQNKGPRMTEKWVNEKELQLWEIQQFNDKQIQLAKQRAAQEQRQLEIKKRLEMNKQHAMNDIVKINGNHVNRNNVVRLNSMIQNRSKILTSANVISPSTSQAIPFHTIHTSNGQAIKLHTVGTTATGNKLATGTQYIIRGNQLVTASNPNTVSLLNVATTTSLSSANRNNTTTAYLVKSPNMIGPTTNNTARLSIIPSALNGPILRPVNAISSSNKQSFPFITTNGPKKISTINTIFTPNAVKPVNSTSITTATTVTNSNPIITAVNLANATPTKNIQCVSVKLADGRTTLVPLSSLAGGNIQLSLNNQPIRVVAKPATIVDNSQSDNSGASKTVLINSNSMISPLNTLILPNSQKVYLQPANSVVKPMAITTNSNTLSQSLTNSPRTVIFKPVSNLNTVVENKSQQTDPISKLQLQPSTIPVTSSVDSNISGIGGNNVEKKDFVVTSEMTQEVVRKALMNANPPEIQQKLIALQRHHLEQTDVSYKPYQVNQSIKKDYQPPPFSVHRHSSRSSRYSKSRYDHEDYIYDFPQSERMGRYNPDRNNCENDVKKICQSIIKQIVDKIDKEEKRKRHEEILMERRHKKAIQMKLKYRQNHIEAIRLNIMRRKSLLNQNIRNSVNRKIIEELTKAKRSALKESKLNTTTISDDESIGQTSWSANSSSIVEPKPKIVEQVVMPVEPNKIKKVGRPRKNPIIPKASPLVQTQSSPIVLTNANNLEQSVIQEENQPKIIDNIDDNKNNDVCEQNHLTVKEIGATTEEKKEVQLCFCEHPDRDAMMIQCDNCERWLHVECVNIEATEIEFIDKYFCPDCEPSKGSSTRKSSLDPMADQSKENTSTSLSLTPDSVAPKNRKRKSPSTSSSIFANKKARMTKKEDQKKKRGRKPKQEKSASQPNENDETNDPGCFCGRSPQWEEQIGCDKCNKWYHAPCVGLTWFRFPEIDPYFCPECQGPETANAKNFQLISNQEEAYAKMNELFKIVKNHPLAGTWLKSQTEEENPHYIREIHNPMDFEKIESKLKQKEYKQICEFVHNVYQTFDNCRYYFGVGSDECKKVLKIDKDWDKILEDHGLKDCDLHAIDHDKLMQQQLKAEAEGIIRKEWLEKKKNQYMT